MYLDDDPGVLISACLFGDGAGAAVLTAEPIHGRRRIEWKSAGTLMSAARSRRAAVRAASRHAAQHPDDRRSRAGRDSTSIGVLARRARTAPGVARDDITAWILHAGGREILAAVRQQLGLTEDDTRWSAAVLRDYGNVSSPCVYFVLEAALLKEQAPGGLLVDVVVRRRLQLPRRAAGGGIVQRRVVPEILDELDASDPRAVQSRRDLQRVHRLMGIPRSCQSPAWTGTGRAAGGFGKRRRHTSPAGRKAARRPEDTCARRACRSDARYQRADASGLRPSWLERGIPVVGRLRVAEPSKS